MTALQPDTHVRRLIYHIITEADRATACCNYVRGRPGYSVDGLAANQQQLELSVDVVIEKIYKSNK
jgi:hypothetical protein